jgi:hypothetical protein
MANATLLLTFRRRAQGGAVFSHAERALFMACEFWAAVRSRKLASHLDVDSIDTLRYMSIIYAGIGALGVAHAVIAAIGELEDASRPQDPYECLVNLQEQLLDSNDPVDQLIAALAEKLGLDSGGGPRFVFESEAIALSA